MHLAFEELNAITTHDDNLEKQYKESKQYILDFKIHAYYYINIAVDENVKLTMSLERARREIRVQTHTHTHLHTHKHAHMHTHCNISNSLFVCF